MCVSVCVCPCACLILYVCMCICMCVTGCLFAAVVRVLFVPTCLLPLRRMEVRPIWCMRADRACVCLCCLSVVSPVLPLSNAAAISSGCLFLLVPLFITCAYRLPYFDSFHSPARILYRGIGPRSPRLGSISTVDGSPRSRSIGR